MRKLLALTLSLLMVFAAMPMTVAFAEGETYLTMFDASSEDASSKIGTGNIGGKVTIVDLENEDHPKAFYVKRTNEWNGFAGAFTGDIRSVAKGVIGIKFWVAGDEATVTAGQSFSVGIGTDSNYYRSTSEVRNNYGPVTAEGAYYTWMWNTGNVYKNNGSFQSTYISTAATTAITENFLAAANTRFFVGTGQYGNTEKANGYQSGLYVDDIQLIYPEGVTPAPVEYTASFEGTETAVLSEAVDSIKSDAQNNDAVVMPEATLVEGEFAGWATAKDFTTVYAPGTTVNITGNTTYYAVLKDKPALETPAAPTTSKVDGSSVTLTAVTGAVYSMDGTTWQTSNVFSGLETGATYTFYQKLSETLTHAESAVSEGLTVTLPVSYKWNIYSEYFTLSNQTLPGGFNTTYASNGTYFVSTGVTSGQTATFTSLNSVAPGLYTVNLYARVYGGRAPIDVYINGTQVASALSTSSVNGTTGNNMCVPMTTDFIIAEPGPIEMVVTATGSGTLYLNALELIKTSDYNLTEAKVKIDGEEVAVLEPGATYTIPTPPTGYYYTDGENDYYGGEEVVVEYGLNLTSVVVTTKVVYTMDEGSQMASANTANIGNGQEGATYEDVDGDMKLALKVKSDQRSMFKLPDDWSNKPYYKPTKITFTLSKNVDTSVAYKNMAFSNALGSYNATAGDVYTIFNSVTYVPMTVSINVTEDMYDYKYITGQFYADPNWSESAPVYAYVDDVTITYEYDFDYVEPTECKVTIDGEEVATVMSGEYYVLPTLDAGKYYVGYEGVEKVLITEDLNLTTATYTYDITIDGEVVATVDYGTEYTLPVLEAGKYYVDVEDTTFVVTEDKTFTTATYTYDITIDGEKVATVEYGTEYTLPALHHSKYYVDVTDTTFVVTSDLTFTTAYKDAADSVIVYDADANNNTGAIGMWGGRQIVTHDGRKSVAFGQGTYAGAGVSDVNMFGSFADYADTAIGVRFWVASNSDEAVNNIKVYIGAPSNTSDNYKNETLVGETETAPTTAWTQYTVMFSEKATAEEIAAMTHIMFVVDGKGIAYYLDDVELLVSVDVDSAYDITIDGEVVTTAEHNTVYTLPALADGKYYVEGYAAGKKFTVTSDLAFTTATYTYTITVDGEVVATVDYGTEYTLPALADGKYYVDVEDTTFVVTSDLEFTTAVYTYDITIDGVVVATVAYGETFTLPAVAEGKQYVDGYTVGQEFTVTEALAFTTEDIPEVDGPTTDLIKTEDGASIRLNEVNGMRFYATVDANLDLTTVEEMGIIIAPQNLVGDYFTMEDDHIKVKYDHIAYDLWEGKQIVGSIVNVADRNLARDFIARAYVVIDGVTYYAETTTVRNLAEIADAYVADADGGYNALEADVKAMVDTWAKAND